MNTMAGRRTPRSQIHAFGRGQIAKRPKRFRIGALSTRPLKAPFEFHGTTAVHSLAPEPVRGPVSGVGSVLLGRRVLLVEDELLLAMDVQMALEDAGASVAGPVDTLERGLALLDRDEPFDVAILDIDLHGEDVFPLAERLLVRRIPFLFHTGHGDREVLRSHFQGAPVCTKPVLTEALVATAAGLLD